MKSKMKIVELAVKDLVPYENNPRHNEDAVKFVAASIKEFGFRVPIIVTDDNVIVAGHTRLLAAKELGLEKVPCIRADDMTEEQIQAFRLADNKVSEMSSWDWDKLEAELSTMSMDMAQFGFADSPTVNWDNVPDLDPGSYKEPEKTRLCCPNCGHIAGKEFFKKV